MKWDGDKTSNPISKKGFEVLRHCAGNRYDNNNLAISCNVVNFDHKI